MKTLEDLVHQHRIFLRAPNDQFDRLGACILRLPGGTSGEYHGTQEEEKSTKSFFHTDHPLCFGFFWGEYYTIDCGDLQSSRGAAGQEKPGAEQAVPGLERRGEENVVDKKGPSIT